MNKFIKLFTTSFNCANSYSAKLHASSIVPRHTTSDVGNEIKFATE